MAFKITATDASIYDTNQIDGVTDAVKTALSLNNVANLSDANLSISTAQQAQFDTKTYVSTANELVRRNPSLDFNFAVDKAYTRNTTNLNGTRVTSRSGPSLSFYRNSAATMFDSTGTLTYAPENLLSYSESFGESSWTLNAAGIIVNATGAPDGISGADKLIEINTTSTQHLLSQSIGVVLIGSIYTFSVYAKAAERTQISLTANAETYFVFDLSAGTVIQGGSNASIVAVGNGWYRCSATFTRTNADGTFYLLPWASTNQYAGTAGNGVYIWGAQLERGRVARTYLSTSTAVNSATKNLILLPNGNTFVDAYWIKSYVSPSNLTYLGPFNTPITATLLTENNSSSAARSITSNLVGNFVPAVGQTYTMSIYVKAGSTWSSRYLQLEFWSAGFGGSGFKNYDITTRTVSTFAQDAATNIIASGIDSASNGWMRIWATSTATLTGLSGFKLSFVSQLTSLPSATYASTGTMESVYIYGAQVVAGDAATDVVRPSSNAVYGPRFDHDSTPLTSVDLYGRDGGAGENLFSNNSSGLNSTITLQNVSMTYVTSGMSEPLAVSGVPYWYMNTAGSETTRLYHSFYTAPIPLLMRSSVVTVSAFVKAGAVGDSANSFAIGLAANSIGVAFSVVEAAPLVTYTDAAAGWSGTIGAADADGFIRCTATFKSSTYMPASSIYFYMGVAATPATYDVNTFYYQASRSYPYYHLLIKKIQIESNARAADYAATTGTAIVGSLMSSAAKRCKGLRIEPESANMFTNSIGVDTSIGWVKAGNITRVGKAIAPDGSSTATTYSSANLVDSYVNQSVALLANTTYTFSVFARVSSGVVPINGQLLVVDYDSIANVGVYTRAQIDIATSGLSASWQRFSITFTNRNTITGVLYPVAGWNNGAQLDVWGAQLEAAGNASSYIPTYASAAVRAADFAEVAGSDFAQFYNNSEGTFVIAADASAILTSQAGDRSILSIGDGTYLTATRIFKGASSNTITAAIGGAASNINIAASAPFKAALALKGGNYAASFNSAAAAANRTNLVLQSEQFNNSPWLKSGASVLTNAIAAPLDGRMTADNLIAGPTASNFIYQNRFATNETLVFSVYAKAGTRNSLQLQLSSFAVHFISAVFNLANGSVTTSPVSNTEYTNVGSSIIGVGSGWYRCSIYGTYNTSRASPRNNPTITVDGGAMTTSTDGLYIWGAQLETGITPTAYIPTSTAIESELNENLSAAQLYSSPSTLPTTYTALRLYDGYGTGQSLGHPSVWVSSLQYYPTRKSNQFVSVSTAL